MKIRIKNNALRYRLTKSDVATLERDKYLIDKIDFGETSLIYAIHLEDEAQLSVEFINNTIRLKMPHSMIDEFIHTDKVGFENNTGLVHLLVEKDFTCLDNVAEDQSDNYPNPGLEKFLEENG